MITEDILTIPPEKMFEAIIVTHAIGSLKDITNVASTITIGNNSWIVWGDALKIRNLNQKLENS